MLDERGLFQIADIGVCGQPYHGLCQGGSLTLPNSEIIAYSVQPSGGNARLLRVPGTPDPVPLNAEETARATLKGLQWLPYAYVYGAKARGWWSFSGSSYHTQGRDSIYGKQLNANGWLWAQSDRTVWEVHPLVSFFHFGDLVNPIFDITLRLTRFGDTTSDTAVVREITLSDVTLPARFNPGEGESDQTSDIQLEFADANDTGSKVIFRCYDAQLSHGFADLGGLGSAYEGRGGGEPTQFTVWFEIELSGLCLNDTQSATITLLDPHTPFGDNFQYLNQDNEQHYPLAYWYNAANQRQLVEMVRYWHFDVEFSGTGLIYGIPIEEWLTTSLVVGGATIESYSNHWTTGWPTVPGSDPVVYRSRFFALDLIWEPPTSSPEYGMVFTAGVAFGINDDSASILGLLRGYPISNKLQGLAAMKIIGGPGPVTWLAVAAPDASDTTNATLALDVDFGSYDPRTQAITCRQSSPVCYV